MQRAEDAVIGDQQMTKRRQVEDLQDAVAPRPEIIADIASMQHQRAMRQQRRDGVGVELRRIGHDDDGEAAAVELLDQITEIAQEGAPARVMHQHDDPLGAVERTLPDPAFANPRRTGA